MKPSPRSSRAPSSLSDSLQHNLNRYALAASAASVGMLVSAQPVEAKIVYTKTYQVIGPDVTYVFDVIKGQHDFIFSAFWISTSGFSYGSFSVRAGAGNFLGHYHPGWDAAALPAGYTVSGHDKSYSFNRNNGNGLMALFVCNPAGGGHCSSGGGWLDVKDRYLGLEFPIKGKLHFGWARLNLNCRKRVGCTAVLTGYAYETIPNKPIITGHTRGPDVTTVQPDAAPGSLGRLALGRK